MPELVYLLCALMSTACTFLLLRSYRAGGGRLLLWSGLCFALLAINNTVLVVDLVIIPDLDFHGPTWRNALAAGAGSLLVFGLVWEAT